MKPAAKLTDTQETKVKNSVTSSIFNEISHVKNKGKTSDKVIDDENKVRKQTGMEPRPYDYKHNEKRID